MAIVKAKFDGRVFVPMQNVQLPIGTSVDVLTPSRQEPLTPEEQREWQEILNQLSAADPHFPSLDEAMRYARKRP